MDDACATETIDGGFVAAVYYETYGEDFSPRDNDNVSTLYAHVSRYRIEDDRNMFYDDDEGVAQVRGFFADGAVAVGLARAWDDRMGCEIGGIDWMTYRPRGDADMERINAANVAVVCFQSDVASLLGDGVSRTSVIESAESEVQEYRDYLRGEVFRWEVTDPAGTVLDSCSGYIGDTDYPMSEARESAKHHAADRLAETLFAVGGGVAHPGF
jgi:hypothetical protein